MNYSTYTSCYDLPLGRFIRCICDNDLTALLIEGQAPGEELAALWEKMYQEYMELSGAATDNYALILSFEIEALDNKIFVIQQCVEVLHTYRCDDLVKILHEHGYRFPFNDKDLPAYYNDLKRVLNRAKALVVQRNNKAAQLQQLTEANKGGAVSRAYFDNVLAVLSKFSQYHIHEDTTTVSRFVAILNLYIQHCEHLNARSARGRSDK